jgi:MerR family redox-sensitive transcriptional activator SoxR
VPADLLTIGEVAARAGVATSSLRFYEREGLLHATRSAGGQRRYDRSVLRRVAFVRAAQRVGLSLEEIRAALRRCPSHARRPGRTGRGCLASGGRGSTHGSRSSSSCATS